VKDWECWPKKFEAQGGRRRKKNEKTFRGFGQLGKKMIRWEGVGPQTGERLGTLGQIASIVGEKSVGLEKERKPLQIS